MQTLNSLSTFMQFLAFIIWFSTFNYHVFASDIGPVCNVTAARTLTPLGRPQNPLPVRETSSVMGLLKTNIPGKDRFVVAWQRYQDIKAGLDIFAAIFDRDHVTGDIIAAGQEFRVNTVTNYEYVHNSIVDQKSARVVPLAFGSFLIVYGQLFDYRGNLLGEEFQVSDVEGSRQEAIASGSSLSGSTNGFVLTWINTPIIQQIKLGKSSVMARLFGYDGIPQNQAFTVNSLGDTAVSSQTVTSLTGGRFVVAWTSQLPWACAPRVIMSQVFDDSTNMVGSPFFGSRFTQENQFDPYVTALDSGGFAIAFSKDRSDGTTDVWLQIFDRFQGFLGEPIAVDPSSSIQSGALVVKRKLDNTVLVIWNSLQNDVFQITGRFIDLSVLSNTNTAPFLISDNDEASQILPSAVIHPDNQLTVSWTNIGLPITIKNIPCTKDCVLSEWSEWSDCSALCGTGSQNRSRSILVSPELGGLPCDAIFEERSCNEIPCPDPRCHNCFEGNCFQLISSLLPYSKAVNECRSIIGCTMEENCLANINNREQRNFLISRFKINGSSWIESWQGNDYGDFCLSMSPFGVVTIPPHGCSASLSAICQIPQPDAC